jgi:hypothetical protein
MILNGNIQDVVLKAPCKMTTNFTLTLKRQLVVQGRDFCAERKLAFFLLLFVLLFFLGKPAHARITVEAGKEAEGNKNLTYKCHGILLAEQNSMCNAYLMQTRQI